MEFTGFRDESFAFFRELRQNNSGEWFSEHAEEFRQQLPEGVSASIWRDQSLVLEGRLGLLIKNGIVGLALVLIALTLFLELKLAAWTAVGIGISFVGAFALLAPLGVTMNTISLFGFILALGIVVDDAIVMGENIFAEREKGASPRIAAERGATRIARPVVFETAADPPIGPRLGIDDLVSHLGERLDHKRVHLGRVVEQARATAALVAGAAGVVTGGSLDFETQWDAIRSAAVERLSADPGAIAARPGECQKLRGSCNARVPRAMPLPLPLIADPDRCN